VSAAIVLGIGLIGGAGAIGRFLLDGLVSERAGSAFPWGTLAVNASGSLALGVVAGAGLDGDAYRLVATGLLGAYTTFSTWMLETQRLGEEDRLALGALNVAGSLAVGLAAVWIGRAL
jgi:CrcB protein